MCRFSRQTWGVESFGGGIHGHGQDVSPGGQSTGGETTAEQVIDLHWEHGHQAFPA